MKLNQSNHTIQRSGDFAEKGFTFEANAVAFDILSSKIYTDVPLAIVRELSTNAYDAHVDANNASHPFDVHLPNALEPFFAIRDYGVGLSPDDVRNVYTTYFQSTRRQSNDYTGCWGLGSKSPFAYVDQFTVTSYYDGVAYTWSMFKGEDNCPTVALLGQSDTHEPNGLEIKINVKQEDIGKFLTAAQKVYQWFKVRPNIVGNKLHFVDKSPVYSNEDCQFFDAEHTQLGLPSRVSLVMGQVCYAVNMSCPALGYGASLVLFADVGECTIAVSREELQYDDQTVEYIGNQQEKAIQKAKECVESHVKKLSGSCLEIAQYKVRIYNTFGRFLDCITKNVHISLDGGKAYQACRLSIDRRDRLEIRRDYYNGRRINVRHGVRYVFIDATGNEITPKWKRLIKYYLRQEHDSKVILAEDISDYDKFEEVFGKGNRIKLEDLPEPPKARRLQSGPRKAPAYIKILSCFSDSKQRSWEDAPEDFDMSEAYVVPRDGYDVIWNGQQTHPNNIFRYISALGITVFGVARNKFSKVVSSSLGSLEDSVEDLIKKEVAKFTEYQIAKIQHGSVSYGSPVLRAAIKKETHDVCKNYVRMFEEMNADPTLVQLSKEHKIDLPTAQDYAKIFYDRYPMIGLVGGLNTDDIPIITSYIKLIDSEKT